MKESPTPLRPGERGGKGPQTPLRDRPGTAGFGRLTFRCDSLTGWAHGPCEDAAGEGDEDEAKDKVAVITGGSSGIGLAIADVYRHEGASVVIFGRNADTLAAAERQLGDAALAVQGDVTDGADLERLFETTAERFGEVDVLVANAGGINFTPLGQTSEEDFDAASDLNFKAIFFTVQAALSHLTDGASVIVTGNALTSTPVVGPSVAIAAKAAVKSLARTFAVELAPRGIRVNVLSPGPTRATARTPGETPDDMTAQVTKQIPLGRWGSPEDAAKAAVFLASADSSYVTGADLPISGGIGMGWVPSATD